MSVFQAFVLAVSGLALGTSVAALGETFRLGATLRRMERETDAWAASQGLEWVETVTFIGWRKKCRPGQETSL